MACLHIRSGPNKGKVVDVGAEVVTIGRDEGMTIQVLDQGVSRQHAEIFRIGDLVFARDLGSTNGTFVNHKKIAEEQLKPGDELLIGTTIITFEGTPETETEGVQFDETDSIGETTIELKIDHGRSAKSGQEVDSPTLALAHDVGRMLHSGRPSGALIREILEHVGKTIGAEAGYLFLLDRKSGKLIPKAEMAHKEGTMPAKVSRVIVRRVVQTGRPIVTRNAAEDERFSMSESIRISRISSVLCAPLYTAEQVRGLLYYQSQRVGKAFEIRDLEAVATAALQISMQLNAWEADSKLKHGMLSTVRALVTAMEMTDPKEQGHGGRVAGYCTALGQKMGLTAEDLHSLRLAALLHDVGKIAVHQAAPGAGREMIREQHVYAGEKVLNAIEGFREILPIVRAHHERADGSGFPYKLTNDQTPVPARILIVVNAFDNACTRGGIGGGGLPARDVLKDMTEASRKEFDEAALKALLECHADGSLYAAKPVEF